MKEHEKRITLKGFLSRKEILRQLKLTHEQLELRPDAKRADGAVLCEESKVRVAVAAYPARKRELQRLVKEARLDCYYCKTQLLKKFGSAFVRALPPPR